MCAELLLARYKERKKEKSSQKMFVEQMFDCVGRKLTLERENLKQMNWVSVE